MLGSVIASGTRFVTPPLTFKISKVIERPYGGLIYMEYRVTRKMYECKVDSR